MTRPAPDSSQAPGQDGPDQAVSAAARHPHSLHLRRKGSKALHGLALQETGEELRSGARKGLEILLDMLLPPRCLSCGTLVDRQGSLCLECWRPLTFLSPPHCACCGLPFAVGAGEDLLCASCLASPPPFDQARSALLYDDKSSPLILALKYGDRTDAAPPFARWMAAAGRELLARADFLVPVPLHWTRLAGRRYNQAALIARALSRSEAIPMLPDALQRIRRTPKLGHLSPQQRQRVLAGAFRLHPARRARLQGRNILLIDDVFTTGATVTRCAALLKKGGAARVDVLTLCRRLRTDASGLAMEPPPGSLADRSLPEADISRSEVARSETGRSETGR